MNCRCHIVSDLFQTPKMNAWCWWIRVCFWVLPSEASQRAWRCRRHGGGMMCIYTYRPIYLSICLNQYVFHFTHLSKDRYLKIFFNSSIFGHYCATNHRSAFRIQCLLGRNSERWIATAMAPNYTGFCKLSTLYMSWHKGTRKMIRWMCALRHGSGPSCF